MTTKQSIPHTNRDKRSCPHNDRFHIQSVNLIDKSTLVYNNVSGPRLRSPSQVALPYNVPGPASATSQSTATSLIMPR